MNKRQAKKKRKKSKMQLIFPMSPEEFEEYWSRASRMHVVYTRRLYTGIFGPPKADEFKELCEAAGKMVSDVLKDETPEEVARQIKIFKATVYGEIEDERVTEEN